MADIFSDLFSKIKNFWAHISNSQRIMVAGLSTLVIAIFFGLVVWLNQTEMQELYTNLSPEDANRVVKSLETQNILYKFSDNGQTILVPVDKVYGLRIKIAGEGSIMGQGIGLEKFDEIKVGATDFVQKINYQRALQGELVRTISEFPSVENVRVHLVMPQRSLFIEEQQKPSASIVIKLVDGKKMDPKEVNAVVNLVVMAVEGLTKERVAITDAAGYALYQPEEEGSLQGMNNTQFEHKLMTQQNLERRIEDLLMPLTGPGRVIAKVNADLDFSHKTINRELYDPEKTVMISRERNEQARQGRAALEGGVPEANFRGDGLNGTTSSENSTSESSKENYVVNKEVQNVVAAVGELSRLTVAVVVDGAYEKNAQGQEVFVPRSDEELKRIKQLVSQAVGFDSARGDVIEVSSLAFGKPDTQFEQNIVDTITNYAVRLGKPLLNALLVFLFLIMVVRPVVMALIRPKVEGEMMEGLEGLPVGEERLALVESSEEELDALAVLEKIEDIKAHAMYLSEQNMEQAIGIIRSWLKPVQEAKAA